MGPGLTDSDSIPPRVTVIIPTYNWSTVLPYSIGSVLAQTFTDFELLVIGDGCTDDSERVVAEIRDPRVRWINIRRTGHQSGPNNEGLRQARGERIAYLGHDDLWLPHHLAQGVAALDAGADFVQSILAGVGPDGRVEAMPHSRWKPPTSVMHRKSSTDSIGGWRDYREMNVAPEHELWDRAAAAGFQFALIPRLTGVKFPAGLRRDVYRERPFHEQAAWLERIRSEPELETELLGRFLVERSAPPDGRERFIRLLLDPRRWRSTMMSRLSKGAAVDALRRYKGVD